MAFSHLLDRRVRISETRIDAVQDEMLPGERELVRCAVGKRRREFAAGRYCARNAMAALGQAIETLGRRPGGAPDWPPGVVGSISHDDCFSAAAVAWVRDGITGLGIDLESDEPLADDLRASVCTPLEIEAAESSARFGAGLWGKVQFSAKESAYKCQYPLSGEMMDFHDFEVCLDEGHGTFAATFQRDVGRFRRGFALRGRFERRDGLIRTAAMLTE